MKRIGLLVLLLGLSGLASAQTKPVPTKARAKQVPAIEVVPVDKEPSHHLVFENEYVRVFSVEVAPHSETKYHRHDRDYVGVILGDSDVESVRVGEAAVKLQLKDGETRFTKGGFAHKAVNKSDKPFKNVTVELKSVIEVHTGFIGSISGMGPVVQTVVIASPTVTCLQAKPMSPGGHVGISLKEGRRYLIVAAAPLFQSKAFREEVDAVKLNPGEFRWVERSKGESVVTSSGMAGFAYCYFDGITKPQGPPR